MESMTKKGACVCWYEVPRHGHFTSDYMAIPLLYQLVLQAKGTLDLKTRETRNPKCKASFSGWNSSNPGASTHQTCWNLHWHLESLFFTHQLGFGESIYHWLAKKHLMKNDLFDTGVERMQRCDRRSNVLSHGRCTSGSHHPQHSLAHWLSSFLSVLLQPIPQFITTRTLFHLLVMTALWKSSSSTHTSRKHYYWCTTTSNPFFSPELWPPLECFCSPPGTNVIKTQRRSCKCFLIR